MRAACADDAPFTFEAALQSHVRCTDIGTAEALGLGGKVWAALIHQVPWDPNWDPAISVTPLKTLNSYSLLKDIGHEEF